MTVVPLCKWNMEVAGVSIHLHNYLSHQIQCNLNVNDQSDITSTCVEVVPETIRWSTESTSTIMNLKHWNVFKSNNLFRSTGCYWGYLHRLKIILQLKTFLSSIFANLVPPKIGWYQGAMFLSPQITIIFWWPWNPNHIVIFSRKYPPVPSTWRGSLFLLFGQRCLR